MEVQRPNRVQPARGEMNTDQLISSAENSMLKNVKTAFDRFCFSDFGVGWLRRALYFELVYYLYYILHAYVTDIYILLHVAIFSDPFGIRSELPIASWWPVGDAGIASTGLWDALVSSAPSKQIETIDSKQRRNSSSSLRSFWNISMKHNLFT